MASEKRSIFWPVLLALVAAPFVLALLAFLFGAFTVGTVGASAVGAALSAPRPLAGDVVAGQQQRAVEACEKRAHGAGGTVLSSDPASGEVRVQVGSSVCEYRDGRARLLSLPPRR